MAARRFSSMRTETTNAHASSQAGLHSFSRRNVATLLLLLIALVSSAFAQQPFLTSHGDNMRSGANTNEFLLAPSNVKAGSFGHLFSVPVDYQVLAQPLYVPNVTINIGPYQGSAHNVVYVVTQVDSVYAIDADASDGNGNGTILWQQSMLPAGAVPASGQYLPCGVLGGFKQEGIVGTPVIDLTTNTMYLVAKFVFNATVYHYLHALDITTGLDQVSPVQIAATSYSVAGKVWHFNSLHQKNRPGALLLNGVLYLGFGSNGCNDGNSGWVLAYDAVATDPGYMQQVGVFNTAPDIGHASIWHTGSGLSADEAGNIFVSTAESGKYYGQNYSDSVLELTPAPWPAQSQSQPQQPLPTTNFFTPWQVAYLNAHDLDVSSTSPLVLPDQNGPPTCSQLPCHEVLAGGKQGIIYVLDRDNMGGYTSGGPDAIIQEYTTLINNGELMATPAYWNGLVYYTPGGSPTQSLQVTNGILSPFAQSSLNTGAHSPSISANGNANGILWLLSGNSLTALDAISLNLLYSSSKSGYKLPKLAHFATQTVANGRVYVASQNSLEAFGLLHAISITGGNNQSAQVLTTLPAPLQVETDDPYTGQPLPGITVSFSDGNKGGTFNPPSAVTDSNGAASTIYTFPKTSGAYTLTVSAPNFGSVTANETATPAAAIALSIVSGTKQTGAAGTVLTNPLVVVAQDAYKNHVPGVTVNFKPGSQGSTNPPSAVTNAKGQASTYYTLPTIPGNFSVKASSTGLKGVSFSETSVEGPAASVTVTGGNNEVAPAGTTLPQPLTVVVADQYGNPVSGVAVIFSDGDAGGSFSNPNPENTDNTGTATQVYTLPAAPATVTITAKAAGVADPADFTETGW